MDSSHTSSCTPADAAVEPAFRTLIRTLGLLKRAMEPYFISHGISPAQWAVLRTLHRAKENGQCSMRLTDLSEKLLVRPPSVTGVVDRLARLSLVARQASQTDQRAKLVSLTSEGQDLVDRIRSGHAHRVQKVLCVLSAQEQNQLHGMLSRLCDHLEDLVVHGKPGEFEE